MSKMANVVKLKSTMALILSSLIGFCSFVWAAEGKAQTSKNVYFSQELQIDFVHEAGEVFIKTNVRARIKNASLHQAKELIFDLSRITTWLGGVREATVIERYSADRQKGVIINNMPFPLEDREIVILLEVDKADENHIVLKMFSDYLGVTSNRKYVRVDPYSAELKLTKDGEDVIFQLNDFYNPKLRSVPQFAVVNHLKSISYDTIDNISKLDLN